MCVCVARPCDHADQKRYEYDAVVVEWDGNRYIIRQNVKWHTKAPHVVLWKYANATWSSKTNALLVCMGYTDNDDNGSSLAFHYFMQTRYEIRVLNKLSVRIANTLCRFSRELWDFSSQALIRTKSMGECFFCSYGGLVPH